MVNALWLDFCYVSDKLRAMWMDRGEDEGAGLAFWEIIHPVASSAGILSGRSSIQLPVLLQSAENCQKKKDCWRLFH